MNWQAKKTTKKGNCGEEIIKQLLRNDGYIIYEPVDDGAHLIDIFCHHRNKALICVEVKTKRRRAYKADTGFNLKHYKEYLRLLEDHRLDTYVAFVDDFEGCVYGQKLSRLIVFAKESGSQVYFPLSEMEKITDLDAEQITSLKKLTTENYDYSNVKRFFKRGDLQQVS